MVWDPGVRKGSGDCEIRRGIIFWWRVLFKERENKLKQVCHAKVHNSNGQS